MIDYSFVNQNPHTFRNEDGHYFQHGGYAIKSCLCGNRFLVAREVFNSFQNCGHCDDKGKQPVGRQGVG